MKVFRTLLYLAGAPTKYCQLNVSAVLTCQVFTHRCRTLSTHSSPSSPSLPPSALPHQQYSVAIVGSGPAGFYTAQQLLKGDSNIVVDIYEKLPVPFGLVRFGVAPDHPDVKNVIHTFTKTAHNERCSFLGNLEIGKDVTLQEMRRTYSAVVLCYGASTNKTLNIPGEDLPNVISARSFVGWYNGQPEDKELQINLNTEVAVILGHGNVALDVARILLTPISILEKTDIAEHALRALRQSRVTRVFVVGRRGPLQVAFTIKELREMIKLPGTRTCINPGDVEGLDKILKSLPRPRQRLTDLLFKTAVAPSPADVKLSAQAEKEWKLVFLRTPLRIIHDGNRSVTGVEFAINKLQGEMGENQKAVGTEDKETISCGLVFSSIGYKGAALDDSIPFDSKIGVIANENSRVQGEKGLYCAGWAGKGPTGVILGTMTDAFETGKVILQDLQSGELEAKNRTDRSNLIDRLKDKAVSFKEWEKIDWAEVEAGETVGKPREKLTEIQTMLKIIKKP